MDKNNNILPFNEEITTRIKFIMYPVWISIGRNVQGKPIQKKHATLAIKTFMTKHAIIHPLTDFIFSKWKHRNYNTMKIHTQNLAVFLNFLLRKQKNYKLYSLEHLNYEHAICFLNNLTLEGKSRATVLSYRCTIKEFFIYLSKNNLNNTLSTSNEHLISSKNSIADYISTQFESIIVPSPEKSNIEHDIPHIYILRFLEIVFEIANPIALGVYMQIFGGLRVGEVVNIRTSEIKLIGPYGQDGLLLNVKNSINRIDIKDGSGSSYVKKPRDQLILGFRDWLRQLYKLHYQQYVKDSDINAIFLNKKGLPMTGASYRYYFTKAKKAFINYLKHSQDPNDKIASIALSNTDWSTHIGRGIFTNMLAEVAKNPQDVALLRGDDNLSSSLEYMSNTKRMKTNLEHYLNQLYINTEIKL
ncbi:MULTISPECIES: site-specific integrase [Bacillus]|uniref:site-specific integrase n=1 Tax=Bacillus TaxID=1386 RepID=UPI001F60561C|nr:MULTISPECIES: site-specific integrase [Bacillus]MDA2145840.1 site-specific integrase [Bacillus cereus group sp. Bc248]MDA2173690.1 site-specific integrase [Bacillus cereus group sp. Bc247]MDA2666293.1 site-specific integrase [Bacillus cereus group sp. Bc032]MDA2677023.1 site-specific integrase [Bacillus cereus group sp. Bc031]MDA2682513.1 site-specific integrase [Bacillus cereus group sp. Bc029]